MPPNTELDPLVVRLLTLAGRAPGAVIVSSGKDASDWAKAAAAVAPACRVETIERGSDIALKLRDSAIRHLFVLRYSGDNCAQSLEDLEPMLVFSRIDLLLLDGFDARAELPLIVAKLTAHGYRLYGTGDGGQIGEFTSWNDGLDYPWYLALHKRVANLLLFSEHRQLNLAGLCSRFGIEIAGLIHLGAHEGEELASYRTIGAFPIAFIEAHPDIYERLVAKVSGDPNVFPIHAAIIERDGPVTLHVSGDDESSSVLPIGALARLIPVTVERGIIEVPGRMLDSLLVEWHNENHPIAAANVMVCDIQGAELLALRGAYVTLPQFDAIVLEVSFDELYIGCGQVEEIDQLMAESGFCRVATVSTWHPSWSDAFYVRR